jgi:endonuclease-8
MKANVLDGSGDEIVTYSGNRRTTHESNPGERLWVYGRQGQECRRCGVSIMMRKQGEQARSTYWCPECQPWQLGASLAETEPSIPTGRSIATKKRKISY